MLIRISIIGLILVFCSGCDSDIGATRAELGAGSLARISCDSAEFGAEQFEKFFKDEPDEVRLKVLEQVTADKNDCEIFSEIVEKSEPLFDELSSGILWPRKVHLFDMTETRSGAASGRVIGFFKNEEICRDYQDKVRDLGYGAGECYERTLFWKFAWV